MRLLILSAALAAAAAAAGQDAKKDFQPKKVEQSATKLGEPVKPAAEKVPTLAEAIAAAMTSNPDVRVAAAEVDLARAKLEQTKVQVASKLSSAFAAKSAAHQTIAALERQFEAIRAGHRAGNVAQAEMTTIELSLTQAKAALATANATYDALAGPPTVAATAPYSVDLALAILQGGSADTMRFQLGLVDAVNRSTHRASPPPEAVADKLKVLLNKTVTVNLKDTAPQDFFDWLKATTDSGIVIRVQAPKNQMNPLTVETGPITVGALLQLVEDDLLRGGHKLYVREYGLLLSAQNSAPEGAMTLQQFWKQMRDEQKPKPAGTESK